jgi:hypothetical protein
MDKRKKSSDVNVAAFEILQEAIKQTPQSEPTIIPTKEKNPAAVALGRLGGLKGGPARAKSLSAKKRKEIARKAANTRWSSK